MLLLLRITHGINPSLRDANALQKDRFPPPRSAGGKTSLTNKSAPSSCCITYLPAGVTMAIWHPQPQRPFCVLDPFCNFFYFYSLFAHKKSEVDAAARVHCDPIYRLEGDTCVTTHPMSLCVCVCVFSPPPPSQPCRVLSFLFFTFFNPTVSNSFHTPGDLSINATAAAILCL